MASSGSTHAEPPLYPVATVAPTVDPGFFATRKAITAAVELNGPANPGNRKVVVSRWRTLMPNRPAPVVAETLFAISAHRAEVTRD